MASVSLFGGGFFYAPFTQTFTFTAACIGDVNPVVPGPWVPIVDPAFPAGSPGGRWMQVTIWNGVIVAGLGQYLVQLGLGAPGFEAPWQPNGGLGGFMANFSAVAGDVAVHWDYSFPITLTAGNRISIRCVGVSAGTLTVNLGIWS